MRNPRLGFLSVTCPTHREAKTETGDSWVDTGNITKVSEGLLRCNIDLVQYENVVASFFEMEEAERLFYNQDVDAIFIYISTWNWADQLMQLVRNLGRPVIVYALVDSKAWSIGGLAATKGGFDEIGIKSRMVYGDISIVL